ncbi:RDD family protein [Neptunomonas sp.]|uniref:RDD family protein n=1 Tax=Neptunomonas sp. TaxID=1971898 RepID=UPI0025F55F9A|nr:RDD family protein [Neptunomonas sp.]
MLFRFKRLVALLIDIVIALVVGGLLLGVVVLVLVVVDAGININLTKYASLIGAVAFLFGYILVNYHFLRNYQASVGKKLLGLKISGATAVPVLMLRTLIPVLISYVAIWLTVVSFVNYVIGFGPAKKCGHDYLFKTEVVNA